MTTLTIRLPPGAALSVTLTQVSGKCIVSSKEGANSPLEANDVILSLNGVDLAEVDGGVPSWIELFQVFSTGERTLVVERGGEGSSSEDVPLKVGGEGDASEAKQYSDFVAYLEEPSQITDDHAPVPPQQLSAKYETIDEEHKTNVRSPGEAAMSAEQIASFSDKTDDKKKTGSTIEQIEDDNAPVPDTSREGIESQEKQKSPLGVGDKPPVMQSSGAPTTSVSDGHQMQTRSQQQTSSQQHQPPTILRPPPPSMLREQSDTLVDPPPMLEATLVDDSSVVEAVPIPINHTTDQRSEKESSEDESFEDQPQTTSHWCRQHRRFIIVASMVFVAVVALIGILGAFLLRDPTPAQSPSDSSSIGQTPSQSA